MPFHLHRSNRLENLADALAEVCRTPLSDPFAEEVIVVESRGMERWLNLALASRLGAWAGCRYPFPNAFVEEVFAAILDPAPAAAPAGRIGDPRFAREHLTWRLYGVLGALKPLPAEASAYLAGDTAGIKRYELAARLADLFDTYGTFRPDWLLEWEEREGGGWLGTLWRAAAADCGKTHRAALQREFVRRLEARGAGTQALPERVSVFGIPSLPPFHLEVLRAIARHRDVHYFLLAPSKAWGASVPRSAPAQTGGAGEPPPKHPLLERCGTWGREFANLLREQAFLTDDRFAPPHGDSLLLRIQREILEEGSRGAARSAPRSNGLDPSIEIHSVHGKVREIEVLRDRLLAAFERDASLEPQDIVVLAPDIQEYTPAIESVFGRDEAPGIPYSITDRGVFPAGPVASGFLALLELARGRATAPEVLGLLEEPPVAARFDLAESEIDTIRRWVEATRIRWGLDARHRAAFGVPPYPQNTWRAGVDRLLLGFALEGRRERLFGGILPYDGIEGSDTAVLEKALLFLERLEALLPELQKPRPLAEWAGFLGETFERFFRVEEDGEEEAREIRRAFAVLRESAGASGLEEPVPLEALLLDLRRKLRDAHYGAPFLGGGVTFCTLLPMRSIPFRVVCLIGLDDGVFPRNDPPAGFDRARLDPRPGDRSRRLEDRYLFLEAVLSARDLLYISYTGRDMREDRVRPPSVVVSEFLELLEDRYLEPPPDPSQRAKRLVTEHPLQPYASVYFREDSPLRSYSQEDYEACLAASGPPREAPPFAGEPLGPPPPELLRVTLDDFAAFFHNPARAFLRERLGVLLLEPEEEIEDAEPLTLDALEAYKLAEDAVAALLSGRPLSEVREILHAEGSLPPGTLGEAALESAAEKARPLAEVLQPALAGPPSEPIQGEIDLHPVLLGVRVEGLPGGVNIRARPSEVKGKDLLEGWIRHLALNALCEGGVRTMVAGVKSNSRGGERRYAAQVSAFEPLDRDLARERLANLAKLFVEGLERPLPFFPESSRAFAEKIAKGEAHEKALAAARDRWRGGPPGSPEGENPYFRKAFGDREPFEGATAREFAELARAVYAPLLDAMIDGSPNSARRKGKNSAGGRGSGTRGGRSGR